MDHRGSDGKLLNGESVKNSLDNNDSDEVKSIDGNEVSKSEREFRQLQDEERRKYKEEELEKRKVITNQIIEKDPKVLREHEVNVALYGHENVDLTLVDSMRKKGQLEPIVITDDNTIISGHRRWLALKYINENKLPRKKLKENSVKEYEDENFIEIKARCVVVNLPREEDRILAVIEYNKRRQKRPSQYYNEIRMLHNIYDAEATWIRNSHLRQYTVSTDLKERYKKEKDSTLNDEEYYGNLYDEGKISDEDVKKSDNYIKAKIEDNKETLNLISKEIGLGRTNVNKLTSIGNLAHDKRDKVAIDILQRLDFFTWSLNNAYNVYKLRYFQTKFKEDSDTYKELDGTIKKVLEASKELDKNVKKRTDIVTDKDVQKYQDIVDELESKGKEKKKGKKNKKEKDEFSVVLIELEDNTEITGKSDINNCLISALFVIATNKNLASCMTLINKLKYTYQTFYFFEDKLLLLGTRGKLTPKIEKDKIETRNELYVKIREYYPTANYHEVPNSNTPEEEPDGWEIPIGKLMSNKEAQKQVKESKKHAKLSKKQVNSKEKSSNFTDTSNIAENNNNDPVGAGQA
jgi:Predicted transcriptional regulators